MMGLCRQREWANSSAIKVCEMSLREIAYLVGAINALRVQTWRISLCGDFTCD